MKDIIKFFAIGLSIATFLSVVVGNFIVKQVNTESQLQNSITTPKMTVYGNVVENNISWGYVIDENSGIVYIIYNDWKRGGMSPAYNSDGTIMTKGDLLRLNEDINK